MHEVLVNRLGDLSLPRKSVAGLTDRPDTTLDVYRGRKTTIQQQYNLCLYLLDYPGFVYYLCKKMKSDRAVQIRRLVRVFPVRKAVRLSSYESALCLR